ncbi:MAG: HYC_CC_PP family protein [Flavobacteriales bacterium]
MKTSFLHRITCLFLVLFMFLSSTGISLNIHYCGDEIADFSLFSLPVGCSCSKDSDKYSGFMTFDKKGCCSFDQFKLDTSDEYRFSQFDNENSISLDLHFASIEVKIFIENSISKPFLIIFPPPEIAENPIYIKNECFLI